MTSTDGITWLSELAAEQNNWKYVTWSPELGMFCAVGTITGGTRRVMFSRRMGATGLNGPQGPSGGGGGALFATIELVLEPGETFVWEHMMDDDIPIISWWVEFPAVYPNPAVRFYYGMQGSNAFTDNYLEGRPTNMATSPVNFKPLDNNSVEIQNTNTVAHRVKAIAARLF
jgi:hypothetical protein